jgi:hypothetical protein
MAPAAMFSAGITPTGIGAPAPAVERDPRAFDDPPSGA